MINIDKYNFDKLNDIYELSSESPSGLVWKHSRYGGRNNKQVIRLAGSQVGTKEGELKTNSRARSWRTMCDKQHYQVHRIMWVLLHGHISGDMVIDHLDGNPFNNTIENLRLVTPRMNQRNRSKNINNKTGEHGVAYHKTSNNSGGYNEYIRVVWAANNKQKHADFNLKRFTSFEDAVEFAALYRELALAGDNSYSKSHGIRESKRKKETNE